MSKLLSYSRLKKTRIAITAPGQNQRGSAAVDYAVILFFTVLVVIAVIVALQGRSDEIFDATTTVIGDFGSIRAPEPE